MLNSAMAARPTADELLEDLLTLMVENATIRANHDPEMKGRVLINRGLLAVELINALDELNQYRKRLALSALEVDFSFRSRVMDEFERRAELFAKVGGMRRGH